MGFLRGSTPPFENLLLLPCLVCCWVLTQLEAACSPTHLLWSTEVEELAEIRRYTLQGFKRTVPTQEFLALIKTYAFLTGLMHSCQCRIWIKSRNSTFEAGRGLRDNVIPALKLLSTTENGIKHQTSKQKHYIIYRTFSVGLLLAPPEKP